MDVQSVQSAFNFASNTGTVFSSLSGNYSPAKADQKTGSLVTSMQEASLSSIDGQQSLFSDFFKSLTHSPSVVVSIRGMVNAMANTDTGMVTISNIPVTDSITLPGFNGLKEVQISKVSVTAGMDYSADFPNHEQSKYDYTKSRRQCSISVDF